MREVDLMARACGLDGIRYIAFPPVVFRASPRPDPVVEAVEAQVVDAVPAPVVAVVEPNWAGPVVPAPVMAAAAPPPVVQPLPSPPLPVPESRRVEPVLAKPVVAVAAPPAQPVAPLAEAGRLEPVFAKPVVPDVVAVPAVRVPLPHGADGGDAYPVLTDVAGALGTPIEQRPRRASQRKPRPAARAALEAARRGG